MMQKFDIKRAVLSVFCIFTALLAFVAIRSLISSLTPDGSVIGAYGQYVGGDFLFFYAAAKLVLSGHINDLYSGVLISGTDSSVVAELGAKSMHPWAWLYPPHYLLLITPLGFLPYYFALGLWLTASLLLPAFVLWHFFQMRGGLWLATIFNMNVIFCLSIGQNALIFAAIAGMGIASLQKRPLLAGICFAVLSMKPHFAILIPVALLLERNWQVLLYTIIGTLFLVIVSSFAFGVDIWGTTITHLGLIKDVLVSSDNRFFSIYSTHRAVLEAGFSVAMAWVAYFVIAIFAFYGFCKIWYKKNHGLHTKWLAFGIAALLCSPYNLAYDAVWVILPVMAWISHRLTHSYSLSFAMCILLAMQIFGFVIVSVASYLAILLIISALILMLRLDRSLDKIGD